MAIKFPHTVHTKKGPVRFVAKGEPIVEIPTRRCVDDRREAAEKALIHLHAQIDRMLEPGFTPRVERGQNFSAMALGSARRQLDRFFVENPSRWEAVKDRYELAWKAAHATV